MRASTIKKKSMRKKKKKKNHESKTVIFQILLEIYFKNFVHYS
ncbi:hypothetical protein PFAG_02991 [Plasmodium falciparum Santa Lucia]|uniref:Uncharacterized protein n=3 Tax=Plasmodium falciparum TaxID=5833 RepID=W4J2E8_PLAFP|nr:hypothetical protein PFNF135_03149 [Plasmodium falciparum NF135/5.C10]ETW56390.1 hypothetical protein PFUGPA_01565 [Plasmodium falciparum Palo Alto/Uganda]EUT85296.1 hypothetical protein PFAG_02991 [Plasmodium falciparum Santa Lucia]